jgi:predicted NACHT family NTPase
MSGNNIDILVGEGSGPPALNFDYTIFAQEILRQKSKPVIGTFAETFKQRLADQKVSSPSERIERKDRSFSAGGFSRDPSNA